MQNSCQESQNVLKYRIEKNKNKNICEIIICFPLSALLHLL